MFKDTNWCDAELLKISLLNKVTFLKSTSFPVTFAKLNLAFIQSLTFCKGSGILLKRQKPRKDT